MPVSYTLLDKKKGAEKLKLSLSARRNIDKKRCVNDSGILGTHSGSSKCAVKYDDNIDTENLLSENICPTDNKFARKIINNRNILGQKRPLNDIQTNTLEGVKRIKLSIGGNYSERTGVESEAGRRRTAMLNGYHGESQNGPGGRKAADGRPPIATLSNLGNTCFLNSVLYTLRFTPRFLHNLHHLAADLALADQRLGQAKAKSSSLGRNFANLANSGSRSWSSKDLLSLGEPAGCKSKIRVATERMHEMFAGLRAAEARDSCEPYQADTFLAALRNVNSIFEGNQQQDAHEFLMCVLDCTRETCRSLQLHLSQHANAQARLLDGSTEPTEQSSLDGDGGISVCTKPSSLGILRKSWKNRKKPKTKADSPTKDREREGRGRSPPPIEEENGTGFGGKSPGFDFVAEDFEGTTVLRTTCLECETVTERKQTMCDISVPISEDRRIEEAGEASEVYRRACVTSECLRDQNKYWCDECARYNEARRSVTYETLPRLLVLQLKRFSGGMEKLTAPMPTPLALACFCDSCGVSSPGRRPHTYTLYSVIMHLGQTLTGGHYIAYVRARSADAAAPYLCCDRDDRPGAPPTNGDRPNFMKNLFARGKGGGPVERRVPPVALCSGADCCGVRPGRGVWPSETNGSPSESDVWLMCDDDTVKPVSAEDFDELLSAKPKMRSASTPYLLFYVRSEPE